MVPVPIGPSTLQRAVEAQERARCGPVVHGAAFERAAAVLANERRGAA